MRTSEIFSFAVDAYRVGYMEAVKAYEPTQDYIRTKDVKKWLRMMCIDTKRFSSLVESGYIKPHKGETKNSPITYSKAEIMAALSMISINNLINKEQ